MILVPVILMPYFDSVGPCILDFGADFVLLAAVSICPDPVIHILDPPLGVFFVFLQPSLCLS